MIWCFLHGHQVYRIGPVVQNGDEPESWHEVCFTCGKTVRKWRT